MKRGADILVFQHPPEPMDLVRWLKKRVRAVNVGVLLVNNDLDLADGFGHDMLDLCDMLSREQEMARIDVAVLDETLGFLGATASFSSESIPPLPFCEKRFHIALKERAIEGAIARCRSFTIGGAAD